MAPLRTILIFFFLVLSGRAMACARDEARRAFADYPEPPWQVEMRARYLNEIAPLVAAMKEKRVWYRNLPGGVPDWATRGLEELLSLMHDDRALFDLLQELEREVVVVASAGPVAGNALERVMKGEEQYYGFDPARVITEYLDQEGFLQLLSQGVPIQDEFWRDKPHGVHTHRLVSVLEARHLHRHFGDQWIYWRLYKLMGDSELMGRLDWSACGIEGATLSEHPEIWGMLHDTPFILPERFATRPDDFTNPEFVTRLREYLPGLREYWQ